MNTRPSDAVSQPGTLGDAGHLRTTALAVTEFLGGPSEGQVARQTRRSLRKSPPARWVACCCSLRPGGRQQSAAINLTLKTQRRQCGHVVTRYRRLAGSIFDKDTVLTSALLDRLVHHAHRDHQGEELSLQGSDRNLKRRQAPIAIALAPGRPDPASNFRAPNLPRLRAAAHNAPYSHS